MTADTFALDVLIAAAGVAVVHTVVGPDHYLPFVMLARARNWSMARLLTITAACGVGHVLSSVLLGVVGLSLGFAVGHLETVETRRGMIAAWGMVAFGTAYALWGVRKALKARRGYALHEHGHDVHLHHHGQHHHHHQHVDSGTSTTFWTLFVVFVLGPCEPLIPLFMLPASRGRWELAGATAGAFGVVTIVAMLALTAAGFAGVRALRLGTLERWSHSLAGGIIASSGLAVIFLGL